MHFFTFLQKTLVENTLINNRTDHCFGPEHLAFRETMRAFVERELAPHVDEWEEAGRLPREHELDRAREGMGIDGIVIDAAAHIW